MVRARQTPQLHKQYNNSFYFEERKLEIIKNLWPISLCNVTNKIFSKALTNKLRCILLDLIIET